MLPNRFTELDIPRQASNVKWMKGDRMGGEKERKIESEDEGDAGGVVEAQENMMMNTEVKKNEPRVTNFINKQHVLSFLQVCFYRSREKITSRWLLFASVDGLTMRGFL